MAGARETHWYDAPVSRVVEDSSTENAERVRARLEGWDSSGLTWRRVKVNSSGELIASLDVGAVTIGLVDQGAPGASAWPVSVATLPLPAGAATAARQDTSNVSLASIDSKLTAPLHVDDNAGSLTVDAADTTFGATVTPKAASTWDVSDRAGRALGTIANTAFTANAGTNLNTSALALDATLTGGTQIARAQAIYNATQPSPADTSQLQLQLGSRGSLRTELFNAGGTVGVAAGVSNTDGQGNSNALITLARGQYWNPAGPSWDLARGNFDTTTGDAGTKVATFNGATQTNYNALGAMILIKLGTVSGTTPTLSCQLQWSYDGGTTWLNIGPALANLTASSQTGLIHVYPANLSQAAGVTPANLTYGATVSMALNFSLPRLWRISYTIAGTTPSFAITAVYVNYNL